MPASFRDVFYPSADGRLQLFARDYAGPEPAVLMMHGLTRNSADFEMLAERLSGRYRIVVPDQRGRGRSAYDPVPANYNPAVYRGDMLALIAHLGLDRPVLIGTSMGGVVAMLLGSRSPDSFRGIVLNDVGPVVDAAGLARIAGYVGKSTDVTDWTSAAAYCRSTGGVAFPRYQDADWMASARRLFREDEAGVPRLAYDPAIAAGLDGPAPSALPNLWPHWDALTSVPILAIRGATSDILSPATLAEMARRHAGLSMVEVANVGHAPMLDEPEAVAAIEAFLESLR